MHPTQLPAEPPYAERNRQSDDDHMHEQPQDQVVKFIRAAGVKGGERKNDKVHDFLHRSAVKQPANERMLHQEYQAPAGRIVKGREREGDEEVQQDSDEIGRNTPMNGLPTQQAGGNDPRNIPSEY